MILWEFLHNSFVLLSPQIRFYLRFYGNFYIPDQHHPQSIYVFIYVFVCFVGSFTLQISVTLNTHQFLLMFCGKLYITDQRHSQYTSVFTYVLWEALHYRSASLSIHISFYLCFVGSFTLQISVTLNTDKFLLRFSGKLYITDQRHSQYTSVFTFVGSFTLQISVTLNTHQFLLRFCGKLYITDQRHSQYPSVFTYVLWEALHYRSASLSTQISFYLCLVGSFTLQISVTLNTHQFLLRFCGKLYITDQRHSQYTSVFIYV